MTRVKPPCYKCDDRKQGCHAGCSKYNEWANKNTARARTKKPDDVTDFLIRNIYKGRKYKEDHK